MKRTNDLLNIFSAAPGEVITLTVRARGTVPIVGHSHLSSGGSWEVRQEPTQADPVFILRFKMPDGDESFAITYDFSPLGAVSQRYEATLAGAKGTSDGPRKVHRPSTPPITLAYVFVAVGDAVAPEISTRPAADAAPPPNSFEARRPPSFSDHLLLALETERPTAAAKKAARKRTASGR